MTWMPTRGLCAGLLLVSSLAAAESAPALEQARSLLQSGRADQARALLAQLLATDPSQAEAHLLLATATIPRAVKVCREEGRLAGMSRLPSRNEALTYCGPKGTRAVDQVWEALEKAASLDPAVRPRLLGDHRFDGCAWRGQLRYWVLAGLEPEEAARSLLLENAWSAADAESAGPKALRFLPQGRAYDPVAEQVVGRWELSSPTPTEAQVTLRPTRRYVATGFLSGPIRFRLHAGRLDVVPPRSGHGFLYTTCLSQM